MLLLQSRPLVSTAIAQSDDLEQLVVLFQTCDRVDQRDFIPSLQDLQRSFEHPHPRLVRRHWQGWKTETGDLVSASLSAIYQSADQLEFSLGLIVHPDYYSTDDPDSAPESLGQQIIHWQEQNLRQHHAQRQPTIEIFGRCRSGHPHYANSYESCGYQAVRWFCTLERSLTSSIPTPEFPDGFSLCPASQVSPEAWVDLFNQTFIDHWNFKPVTVSDRQFRLAYPTYQPELDWVALAPDGRPAGFCSAIIDRDRNQQTGENIGWIGLLGTRRGYRRRGLARAMLLYGLQQLQADGLTTARIGVDADNPNQAQTLYESVGFQVTKSWVTYQKELSLG